MKKRSRTLAVITFVILLIAAVAELVIVFLQASGKYENRGELSIGPVCFSPLELVLLSLLFVAAIAGGVCVYTLCRRKTVLMYQYLDAIGDTYLRIVRINYVTGVSHFIKDNDKLAEKVYSKTEWNAFRDKLMGMVHPEDLEMYKNFTALGNMRRVAQKASGTDVCMYRRMYGGEYKWIRALLIPVQEKGYEDCVVLCARDVEESAKAEEFRKARMLESLQKAKEAEAEKADFLKFIYYELSVPLEAAEKMGNLGHKALESGDNEKADYYFERLVGLAKYSEATLNDIMRKGVMLEPHMKVKVAQFSMSALVAACTEYARALTTADMTFELYEDEQLGENYIGDSLRLKQVLFSLLSNAYKFNRSGGYVKFSAKMEERNAEADKVMFVVEDTGCGIGDDFLPILFEPFAKENQPTEVDNVGVGYGLAQAKSIADAIGASIDVDTSVGEGSRFMVGLWLKRGN